MVDLFEKIPLIKTIARKRWLQFILVFPTFIIFYILLMAGVFGTPVGNKNVIVIFVWILWWVMLIALMMPFASRIWCLVCPFPIIGEWFQRMAFIKVRKGNNVPGLRSRYFGGKKPWPKKLRNIWIQNFGFLSLAIFSPFLVTRPMVSLIVLGGLFFVATVIGIIYKQRAFCVYVCPVSGFLGLYSMASKIAVRAKDPELCNRTKTGKEKDFNFDNGIAGCRLHCPTGMDASSYIAYIRNGMYKEALEVMREATPFVGSLGRVCTHPCESECLRNKVDDPVSICRLKRFTADYVGYDGTEAIKEFQPLYKEKVAVIGSGPVGLSCAYHLAKKGYDATVYEALPVAGGMLRVGIPNFHLPKDIVNKEIDYIKNSGVRILTDKAVGKDISFDELRKEYKAVFIAVGASKAKRLKIEGEEMQNVSLAIDFLRQVNMGEKVTVEEKVVVIGGGKTAEDTARTALRLGAKDATCIEVMAEEDIQPVDDVTKAEGVITSYSTCPVKITGADGKATSLLCVKMRKGEIDENTGSPRLVPIKGSEHLIPADNIIIATGQYSDIKFLPEDLNISPSGTIIIDPQTLSTNIPGIFAGGDVVSGPDILVKGLGYGRKAALAIDNFLREGSLEPVSIYPTEKRVEDEPLLSGVLHREERISPPLLPVKESLGNFNEVEQPFTKNMAQAEAQRCLSCGICGECYRGTEKGWACAWFQKMGGMDRNNYCGLCMECVKSCPHDNITVYGRPFAGDNAIRGMDEAWKAFIMMVLSVIYPINLLSPWGKIKDWLNFLETGLVANFLLLTANMWLWCLVLFPFIHYLFCKWSKALAGVKEVDVKELFKKYAYAYVPLGFMAWICFSLPLVLISGAYIISVISDPFGWGWNLIGTVDVKWSPIIPNWVPYIQAPILLLGFFYSVVSLYKIAKRIYEKSKDAIRSIIPVTILLFVVLMVLFRLYLG